jgi:bifunctional DNase/RNase
VEAQSIAMEMENIQSSRPLTHDLFRNTLQHFSVGIREVAIERLEEGIFYSTIYFSRDGDSVGIDSRTSDAIALAMKFKCPIFVNQNIMDDAGYSDEEEEMDFEMPGRMQEEEIIPQSRTDQSNHWDLYTLDELEALLDEAISIEDYGRAAKIRDEIKRRE